MSAVTLSNITLAAIRKKRKRQLALEIIKTLLFWGVTIAFLLLTEGPKGEPFREARPVAFRVAIFTLVILPILYFKFYRFLFRPTFRATVIKLENDSRLGGREREIKGFIGRGHFVEMGRIDICFVTVETERGRQYTFTYPREKATFARQYFQPGDHVFCPALANFPFNEDRAPQKPFCMCCGEIATSDADVCPKCRVPLVR